MIQNPQEKKRPQSFTVILLIAFGYLLHTVTADAYQASGLSERWARLCWYFPSHSVFIIVPLIALLLGLGSAEQFGLVLRCKKQWFWFGLAAFGLYALLPSTAECVIGRVAVQPRLVGHAGQTVLFQLVFAAFGEELFFRGFMQSSFNRLWGRNDHIGKVRFGPGLYLTAILFGLGHCIAPVNIFSGTFQLDWGAFGWATWAGFVLGFAREQSGTLHLPTLLHYGMNFYVTTWILNMPGHLGLVLAEVLVVAALLIAATRVQAHTSCSG